MPFQQIYIMISPVVCSVSPSSSSSPYLDFEQLALQICEGLFDTVDFPDQLIMHLYPSGGNQYLGIAISPINELTRTK